MFSKSNLRREIVDLIISYEAQLEFSSAIHPKNAAEQKRQFLQEEIENPVFEYEKISVPKITFPELDATESLSDLYQERMQHTNLLDHLLEVVGNDQEFTAISSQLFPVLSLDYPELTYEEQPDDSALLSAEDVEQIFEDALARLSLEDWRVEIETGISSRMYVNQWDRHIGIRADVQVTEKEADRLTRHEIGVHVLRAANGHKQTEPLLHVGTHKGRLFEEGVACYVENPNGPSRMYLRHHAVQLAQKSSFRDTWQGLLDVGVPAEPAWAMALRVKRGLIDTAKPGGFTRDALYAQAFTEMKTYMDAGGDIAPLLSAPIHPSEIEKLIEQAGMKVL